MISLSETEPQKVFAKYDQVRLGVPWFKLDAVIMRSIGVLATGVAARWKEK